MNLEMKNKDVQLESIDPATGEKNSRIQNSYR